MSSVVHFKFNSSLKFDIIHFDGPEISLKELKAEIVEAKKLDKTMKEYDLLITNQNSKTEYKPGDFIPKNSSVIVSRIPIMTHKKAPKNRPLPSPVKVVDNVSTLECISKMTEVASLDLSEEDKLATVMDQGNKEFDVLKLNKNFKPRGPLPRNYVCHRCHVPGHHIQDCTRPRDRSYGEPMMKLKKSSGIPRSFLTVVEDINTPGVLLTSSGELVVPKIEAETYGKKENTSSEKPQSPGLNGKAILPKELVCPVCSELQVNPVVLPCCSQSACDNCAIAKLLQSNPKCPVCKTAGVLIADVKPNEELAALISSYKNDLNHHSAEKKVIKEESFAENVPDSTNVKAEIFEKKPKSESSEISDSSEGEHEKKTPNLKSEETAVTSSATPPVQDRVSRIQTVPLNTYNNMTGVTNYPNYTMPLNYQIPQNSQMVQQGMNIAPYFIYSDTGVPMPYIYQYGPSALLPPNGAMPYQNFAPRPMTEEEFYRTQRRFRDVGRGGRYRERSPSPRRYGRKDLYDEQRVYKKRRRSRSYERSTSRSRTRQYSPDRRRASPVKARKYRSPGQSPNRSPSWGQYLPDARRRTPSKVKRYLSPDLSLGRSPSPGNYNSGRPYKGSPRRSDSPRKPRGRRSITPADPYRSPQLSYQRSRSRSRSPVMKRHPIDEEQSVTSKMRRNQDPHRSPRVSYKRSPGRTRSRSKSPAMKRYPLEEEQGVTSKMRRRQDERKRSSSPPSRKTEDISARTTAACLPQKRQEASRPQEKELSDLPPRRKRPHSKDHRSHSRESLSFKAERKEERMTKETQRESEKMYTREKFGKADLRDQKEATKVTKEQKADTKKMRADKKEYNHQDVGRPVETERANKSELRKESFKEQESFEIKKKRKIEERTDNYSSKVEPKKSEAEAQKDRRSTKASDNTRSPQQKPRPSKESVKVTKELLNSDKDPIPNEASSKRAAKETSKNDKGTVFARLDFGRKKVEKGKEVEASDEKCYKKSDDDNKARKMKFN